MEKPYMPLMMGDWVQGTRGMRADVKGVYIGLLIYQYDHGYIPAEVDDLQLIEPEVVRVWDKLEGKFPLSSSEPGIRRNEKLEKVRAFWNKQKQNGKQGGRPKQKPKPNPKENPNNNLHNDIDLDTDHGLKKNNGVRNPEAELEAQIIDWEDWGKLIVQRLDPYWHGRQVTPQEMEVFISVAIRNDWTMDSQQKFRNVLKGFDWKKGTNSQQVERKRTDLKNL